MLLNAFNRNQTWGYELINASTYTDSAAGNTLIPEGYRYTTDLIMKIHSYYHTVVRPNQWTGGPGTYDPSPNIQLGANSLQHYFFGSGNVDHHPLFVGNPENVQFAGGIADDTDLPSASFRSATHIIHLRKRFSGDISLPSNTSSFSVMYDALVEDSSPSDRQSIFNATASAPLVVVPNLQGSPGNPGVYVVASYAGLDGTATISWAIEDYIDLPIMDSGGYYTKVKIGFISSLTKYYEFNGTRVFVNGGENLAGSLSLTTNSVQV